MEEAGNDSDSNPNNAQDMVIDLALKPGYCHLPLNNEGWNIRDLDGCRLLYLSYLSDSKCSVPEKLAGSFAVPTSTSHKTLTYSAAVCGCIISTGVAAMSMSSNMATCTPNSENKASPAYCAVINNIPNALYCAGSILANIVGLIVYDYRNNAYEARRNTAQDSAKELETIYENIAKFALRTFLFNLNLVKERILKNPPSSISIEGQTIIAENDISENINSEDSMDLSSEAFSDFQKLDKYIADRPIKFKDIFRFLHNFNNIVDNLKSHGVNKETTMRIEQPFKQIRELLIADLGKGARAAIVMLIFKDIITRDHAHQPYTLAIPIFDIITDEGLTALINNIVK